MSHSGSVRNLQFPADKENTRWVHCNYFYVCPCKGLLIYLCITQEGAFWVFTKLELLGFYISVLFFFFFPDSNASLHQLHTKAALSHCAIFWFSSANSHSPCLF